MSGTRPPVTCSVEGCEIAARSRGWCPAHYARWMRNGDPLRKLKGGRSPLPKMPGLRGVRTGLGLTRVRLSVLCGVPVHALDHAERGEGVSAENRRRIHAAVSGLLAERRERLQKAGVA